MFAHLDEYCNHWSIGKITTPAAIIEYTIYIPCSVPTRRHAVHTLGPHCHWTRLRPEVESTSDSTVSYKPSRCYTGRSTQSGQADSATMSLLQPRKRIHLHPWTLWLPCTIADVCPRCNGAASSTSHVPLHICWYVLEVCQRPPRTGPHRPYLGTDHVFLHYGLLLARHSDKETNFKGHIWKELPTLCDILLTQTFTSHCNYLSSHEILS